MRFLYAEMRTYIELLEEGDHAVRIPEPTYEFTTF